MLLLDKIKSKSVDHGKLIPYGSPYEIELRMATIFAGEDLRGVHSLGVSKRMASFFKKMQKEGLFFVKKRKKMAMFFLNFTFFSFTIRICKEHAFNFYTNGSFPLLASLLLSEEQDKLEKLGL